MTVIHAVIKTLCHFHAQYAHLHTCHCLSCWAVELWNGLELTLEIRYSLVGFMYVLQRLSLWFGDGIGSDIAACSPFHTA